jgi:hypothetical protein
MCWPHVNPVPSGAVGKDCQRRLLSRPRFVRACSATDLLLNPIWIENCKLTIIALTEELQLSGNASDFYFVTVRRWSQLGYQICYEREREDGTRIPCFIGVWKQGRGARMHLNCFSKLDGCGCYINSTGKFWRHIHMKWPYSIKAFLGQ